MCIFISCIKIDVTLLSYLILFIIIDKKIIKLELNSNKDKRVIFNCLITLILSIYHVL